MRIIHNLPALNAYRNMASVNGANAKSMEKLTSGLRINRAADDAAGLAISEAMRGQIKGLNQASRNSQDAISLLQTAEGALTETHSILHRMRELATQAANDTYTSSDRLEIQKEVDQLKEEVDRIANTTNFNAKNLLDGSASALSSSDKLSTKVFVRGGLRTIDQFGMRSSTAGTYKLEISATAGDAQIQKSGIFKNNQAGDSVQDLVLANNSGLTHVAATGLQHGDYDIDTTVNNAGLANQAAISLVQDYQQGTGTGTSVFGSGAVTLASAAQNKNMSILAEVTAAAGTSVTWKVSYYSYAKDGSLAASGETTVTNADITAGGNFTINGTQINYAASANVATAGISVGDKSVFNVKAEQGAATTYDTLALNGTVDGDTGAKAFTSWVFNEHALDNKTSSFNFYSINAKTGETTSGTSYDGSVSVTVGGTTTTANAATFSFQEGLGQVASLDTQLSDIDKFWDASGKFLLDEPQTLTLVQGNGNKTNVTLFKNDTIKDVRDKLNEAIKTGLGQGDLVSATQATNFVSYVTKSDTASETETTSGTFVIRSAKAGAEGEINVIGNEQLINAFGLAEIQVSTESKFSIDVTDAHDSSNVIASDVEISGNKLVGVVHQNVDVEFDSNADIAVGYNTTTKSFTLSQDSGTYTTFVHLVDNTQVFQIGANEMQDMGAAIGNMGADALGIKDILVTDRKSAGKAISTIDGAIASVSAQRSSVGAVQNRLEHTINNLGIAAENLTSSESRIRDVDMASEMMEFTKLNILSQASMAMLAQANQKPQSVLQLLQGGG